MTKEIWKPVEGFEKHYAVSTTGRVKNITTKKLLKPHFKNYFRVSLYYIKPHKNPLVHRLVAGAFLKNPFNKPEINHLNFARRDNRVENLEYASRKENVRHAIKRMPRGENSYLAKLNSQQVRAIRGEYARGKIRLADLAVKYGTGFANISAIVLRKSWRHL